jgi:hypothetical protein
MKRTCVRSPDRFEIMNIVYAGYRFSKRDNPAEALGPRPGGIR